jgi:hypothetical protein
MPLCQGYDRPATVKDHKFPETTTFLSLWRTAVNELDSDAHLRLMERQIGELEQRLGMLREQIVAMAGDGHGGAAPSELLLPTFRALRCLELLRIEIREDMARLAFQPRSQDSAG